jgi:hypothetical protein
MKLITAILILLMAVPVYAADGWQSIYGELGTVAGGDVLAVIDVSDTTDGADGTIKYVLTSTLPFQASSANLSLFAAINPSANVQSLLGAADYSAMRTQLSLVPGTNVQAYDADLTTYAGITPSSDIQALLALASYAALSAEITHDSTSGFVAEEHARVDQSGAITVHVDNIPEMPINDILGDADDSKAVDIGTNIFSLWTDEAGEIRIGEDASHHFYYTLDSGIPAFGWEGDAVMKHGESVVDTGATIYRNADSTFLIEEDRIKVPGPIIGDLGHMSVAESTPIPDHWSGTVLVTDAATIGFPDCRTATLGQTIEVITGTTNQVVLGIYGDESNDYFRLKAGTALDANDDADLPTTGYQRFTCKCLVANEWWVTQEDAAVTDGAGGTTTDYYGFPETAGVPDAPSGSWTEYGTAADRTYCNVYDPSGNGTITGVNVYVAEDNWGTGGNAWVVVYREATLIGYSDAIGACGDDDWTGYLSLNVVGGQNLNYDADDDEIYYCITWDRPGGGSAKTAYDSGGSAVDFYYDDTASLSGAPDSTLADPPTTSSSDDLGIILRVEE